MIKLVYNFIFKTKRRRVTVKALYWNAVSRFRVRFLPQTSLYKYMGTKGCKTPEDVEFTREEYSNVRWVAYKVERVANRTPWQSKCLVRAMVAQRLLRDYKLPSTLYLGVGRDENNKMTAHAWVRCGRVYVTGGDGSEYATVAHFAMVPEGKEVK